MIYEPAPEVEAMGKRIIEEHHPMLRGVRVEYVFREKASTRHGRTVAGTAKKVTGVNALLATPGARSSEDLAFFLITIAKNIWAIIDPKTRRALLDHELQHCAVTIDEHGDATLSLRGHDIEEFAVIVGRHGLWSQDLEMFVSSLPAEQLEFATAAREDIELTISHVDADGVEHKVETSTDGLRRAADVLRHGSGVLGAGDVSPGQEGFTED